VVDDAVAAVAVLLWATTIVEAVTAFRRQPGDPAQKTLTLGFLLLATTATFFVPAIQTLSAHLTGIANISEPLARTALLGTSWSGQVLLLRLHAPAEAPFRARSRTLALLIAVACLWLLFAVAPIHRQTRLLTGDYGSDPLVAAYIGVSLAYLAFALIDFIRGAVRYASSAPRALGTGLRIIGAGCGLGLGYVAVKAAFLISLVAGQRLMSNALESTVSRSLAVGGGVSVAVGAMLPFLASRAARTRAWGQAFCDLRRLYPLWELLYRATPGIALDPTASSLADTARLRDVQLRLYRRVIEIRDGRLALAEFLDPTVARSARATAEAARLPQTEADAVSEAALLMDAVTRKAQGHPTDAPPPPSPDASDSLADEVEWLLRVTRQLRRLRAASPAPSESTSTPTPRTAP
jgi:hypothetical protein